MDVKAVIWTRYGPPEVLEVRDVEKPIPGEDEILIRVHAANAFPGDAEMRRFQMHPSMWLPIRLYLGVFRPRIKILGQELSGVVETVGDKVTRFKPGDAVFGVTGMRLGAYAEYTCLPEPYALTAKPDAISDIDASTIAVGGGNALHFIRKAALEPGEKILVYGACGSIGTYAVQLARMQGAEVTAVDSHDKLGVLSEIGAHKVIDYEREDFTRNGEKYDVILDVVGKSPYFRSLRSLTSRGRYVLVNVGLSIMLLGWLTSKVGDNKIVSQLANPTPGDLDELASLVENGELRPVIDHVYPLDEAVEAHRYIETGTRKGHVVLSVASVR